MPTTRKFVRVSAFCRLDGEGIGDGGREDAIRAGFTTETVPRLQPLVVIHEGVV
jgi:hypothetical protein